MTEMAVDERTEMVDEGWWWIETFVERRSKASVELTVEDKTDMFVDCLGITKMPLEGITDLTLEGIT